MAVSAISILTRSFQATAALTRYRFVTAAGAVPAAGANTIGVTLSNAAIGEMVAITMLGTEIVESGAAVATGAAIETDNQGRAITKNTGATIARALTAATAAGQLIEVSIIPN